MEYYGPVKIKQTDNGMGRGLFATRDIKKGEVVICEKAFINSDSELKAENNLFPALIGG